MPNCLYTEHSPSRVALETLPIGLVSNFVRPAEPFVQEDNRNSAHDGEQSDDCRDPQSPCICTEIPCNDVRGGLTSELSKIRDSPGHNGNGE